MLKLEGGTPNGGISGAYFYNSSADTIFSLQDLSVAVGGSAGWFGLDIDGELNGGTISVGASALQAELHGVVTFGKVLFSW